MNDLYRLCRIMGTFDLATGHVETMSDALDALEEELKDVLGHFRARREWVGLTEMDMLELDRKYYPRTFELMIAVEAKLKEKNA